MMATLSEGGCCRGRFLLRRRQMRVGERRKERKMRRKRKERRRMKEKRMRMGMSITMKMVLSMEQILVNLEEKIVI